MSSRTHHQRPPRGRPSAPPSRLTRVIKTVIAVKLVALLAIWALLDGGFYLGDRPSVAGEATPTGKAAEDDGDGVAAGKGEAASGDKGKNKDRDADREGGADGAASKPRKSFLANLLELPELDPGSVKKDELGRYLEIAERKKRQIEDRLGILKKREDQLKGLEASIDDKLKKLDEERRFFAQTIQQEKTLKGERIDKLVTMYAKMEPKKAAPVIEKLDKDLVVELFKQMPQKQVTAILESMSPDKSVTVSEYYGRVRSAREYDLLKEMNQSLRKEFDDCKGMPKVAE
jgi:flagellar motility protein MotE (MotC chaperone)